MNIPHDVVKAGDEGIGALASRTFPEGVPRKVVWNLIAILDPESGHPRQGQ